MKLELKHLAPYLPYSLKVEMEGKKCNVAWMSTKNIAVHRPCGIGDYKRIQWKYAHLNIKPFLKPLSQLNNNEWKSIFVQSDIDDILDKYRIDGTLDCVEHYLVQILVKHHFDISGLIEAGLAIDINTLKNGTQEQTEVTC